MLKEFIDSYLDRTKNISKKVHNLNNGGCGYYALYLYFRLKELGFKNICIRPLLDDDTGVKPDSFNKLVKTGEFEYAVHNHIMVHIWDEKHYLLDSENIFIYEHKLNAGIAIVDNYHNDNMLGSKIPISTLEEGLAIKKYWVKTYDRKQNKTLKELINKI